jgi:hypothetical protein
MSDDAAQGLAYLGGILMLPYIYSFVLEGQYDDDDYYRRGGPPY